MRFVCMRRKFICSFVGSDGASEIVDHGLQGFLAALGCRLNADRKSGFDKDVKA